jgi:hypothetical protein
MATIKDMKRETMNEIPNGFNMRPSIPERKKSGKKATMIINVAFKMEARISFDASKTIVKTVFLFEGDN